MAAAVCGLEAAQAGSFAVRAVQDWVGEPSDWAAPAVGDGKTEAETEAGTRVRADG
jgi:hypothetical protein